MDSEHNLLKFQKPFAEWSPQKAITEHKQPTVTGKLLTSLDN